MVELDETDLEILSLLAEDARRPYSEIGETVDLSGPAVSDRVTRLRQAGILRGFTVDVDRSQLRGGVPVFVRVETPSDRAEDLAERVRGADAVEHVFVTADGDVWFSARLRGSDVRSRLDGLLADVDAPYSVTLLDDVDWQQSLEGTEFALTCAECGNTVDSEGESVRLGDGVHHFCCPSCRSQFEERYERLEEGA